jgi:hypothetical protein
MVAQACFGRHGFRLSVLFDPPGRSSSIRLSTRRGRGICALWNRSSNPPASVPPSEPPLRLESRRSLEASLTATPFFEIEKVAKAAGERDVVDRLLAAAG